MSRLSLLRRAAELAERGEPFVLVTLVDAQGSTPQDAGAKMIVTAAGLDSGTVGGGALEHRALERAQRLLVGGADSELCEWNLKADVGMTCGGAVRLYLERFAPPAWRVAVFGAGHVAQALAGVLVGLPCRATFIDPRPEWLDRLPPGVDRVVAADPAAEVDRLEDGTFVLCMTRGHKSDLPVLLRLFTAERAWPYVGVIGSRAKRAVLLKELRAAGAAEDRIAFHCPVGLPIGTNHPGEIAVSIAAQLLAARDGTLAAAPPA